VLLHSLHVGPLVFLLNPLMGQNVNLSGVGSAAADGCHTLNKIAKGQEGQEWVEIRKKLGQ